MSTTYEQFLETKSRVGGMDGFEPLWMPDFLFPFQRTLVDWAIRKGRAEIGADCGMGKSPMLLAWAQNVIQKENRPVLLMAPLAVSYQLLQEAEKFGIAAERSAYGGFEGVKVVITNYQKLRYFDPSMFAGVVCDESSILKNFDGALRKQITEFMSKVPYRLLCTATAAPNDFHEVGTSSEALGYLGARDMLTRFFKEDVKKDYLGWGRKAFRFRGHAEQPFWRWVCSWMRACRKPSDLGFPDGDFILPPLIENEHIVQSSTPRDGMLFSCPAQNLHEQREERRVSMRERCEAATKFVVNHEGPSIIWCHLNDEGDMLEEMIPNAVQVYGSMSDEEKEEKLVGFAKGRISRLVLKPKIGAWGLNYQHCHNVVTFPAHSWEQYYQSVRRCWRFGQKHPVTVTIVSTEGERGVVENLQRKARQADHMFNQIIEHMAGAVSMERDQKYPETEEKPAWL